HRVLDQEHQHRQPECGRHCHRDAQKRLRTEDADHVGRLTLSPSARQGAAQAALSARQQTRLRAMKTALLCLLLATPALAESAGGISWTAPTAWKVDAPRPMRAATYLVPAAKGDSE